MAHLFAFNKGSAKGVITGVVFEDLNQIIAAIKVIEKINRSDCRELVKNTFNVKDIAQQYLSH